MWLKLSDSQFITNTQIIRSIYMSKNKYRGKKKENRLDFPSTFNILFGLETSAWSCKIIAAIATGLLFNKKWEHLQ